MSHRPSLRGTKRTSPRRPQVNIGVIVTQGSQVLLLRRGHAPEAGTWSVPWANLEYGETLEACAIRALKAELAGTITDLAFRAVTNNLFEAEQLHYITIWQAVSYVPGESGLLVPDTTSDLAWFSWDALPAPLFLPLQHLLTGQCYPALWNFDE